MWYNKLFFAGCVIMTTTSAFFISQWATAKTRLISTNSLSMMSDVSRSLWTDRVQYIDLSAPRTETSPTARTIPLFILGGAFYPQGLTFLNVFEMKYRTMMFDCANSDDRFGYMHSDGSGQIASVGTMCKVTDRDLQEDGRQTIKIFGEGRLRVVKILKTLPYVLAEVEPFIDDEVPSDEAAAAKLEVEVYTCLKYYMRLMKIYSPERTLVITHDAKKCRPTSAVVTDVQSNQQRRTLFSFSLANMISMVQPYESQLLLQTTDVMKRLRAEKDILTQASELVEEQLLKLELLTADARDGVKFRTYNEAIDADEDILPPDIEEEQVKEEKDEWDLQNIE